MKTHTTLATCAIFWSVLFFSSLPSVATETNCFEPPAGIVGWWPLDGSVSEVINSGTTTLAGVPTYVPGKVGPGLSFDGVTNYVRATASSALNVGASNGFTLELWINPAQVEQTMPLIEWNNASGSYVHFWTASSWPGGGGPGSLYGNIVGLSGVPHKLSSPTGIVVASTFQHVALTYNKTNGVARIYLNGNKVAEQNFGTFTPQTDSDVYFGVRPVAGDYVLYHGLMDEIGFYNRALSDAEIQAIVDAGTLGKCKVPAAPSITSQPQGKTVPVGTNVAFTVTASGTGPLFYQWNFNGASLLDATNSTLALVNVQPEQSGEYRVIVTNSIGSVTSQVATLTVFLQRTLALQAQPPSQEGTRVRIPITLTSTGDVAGMTFLVQYDANFLRDPQFTWDDLIQTGFNQENHATPGQISASFVLSDNIPGDTQTVAVLDFLLRSVPASLDTALTLTLQDASDSLGNPIPIEETLAQGCTQRITVRRITGDNNANDRLDVGDATIILRFLALLDPVRAWDASGNDVNQNSNLDSGDVTKVLRAAAGIDPQPPVPPLAGNNTKSIRKNLSSGSLVVTPSRTNGLAGQQVTVQVRLQSSTRALSGAAFTLSYSTNALRLQNSSSFHTGPLVPNGTLTMWNVSPSQNNFAVQNGNITFVTSSATSWPDSNGVLAEFTFNIQGGATSQHLWQLTINNAETTASGFDNQLLPAAGSAFVGRSPVGGRFSSFPRLLSEQFEFSFSGDPGAKYAVDASTDLIQWTVLHTNVLPTSGSLLIQDPAASEGYRFYRARVVP
jgi:hypothetical protein